jgi:hypothetical protein
VPPFAASKRPAQSRDAPVNEPRAWPNSSDSNNRSYAAEPDVLVKELAGDEAIKAADTLLLTIPNQLGVDYNAHVLQTSSSTLLRNSTGADREPW